MGGAVSAILSGMVFGVQRLKAWALAASLVLALRADESDPEASFKTPPPNATRPCVALTLDRTRTDGDWLSRQLERVRDVGAGGVLLGVPAPDGTVWSVLSAAVNRSRQLGLDVGIRDFYLSPDEAAAAPRARQLVWSCMAPEAGGAVTDAVPQAVWAADSYRELARLAVPADAAGDLQPHQILDLAAGPAPTGGVWRVWRFGTADAAPGVIDPLSDKALFRHVNQWLSDCQKRMGRAYSSTVLWFQLSGPARTECLWSDDLPEAFLKRSGLGLVRHLPALAGEAVGGEATAAYVRRQMTQTVREVWRERFGKTVDELVHEAGLEAGLRIDQMPVDPVEAALYFRRPVLPAARDAARRNANVLAAGGARAMGRRYVMGALSPFAVSPTPAAVLLPFPWKHEADRLLADGATRLLLEAGADGLPSEDATFRQLLNGCTYVHRCQMLLQQGEPVADVLVWAAEPLAALSRYACDAANGPMLETAAVKGGVIRFDSGREYGVLAVAGDVLADPAAERTVRQMASRGVRVWLIQTGAGDGPQAAWVREAGENVTVVAEGAASAVAGAVPDFEWRSDVADLALRFLHRRTSSHEVYFVVNDSAETGTAACTFRDAGKGVPARWDPLDGEIGIVEQAERSGEGGRVSAPLFFAPHDTCFVVFER
jgi:hypothetical protein